MGHLADEPGVIYVSINTGPIIKPSYENFRHPHCIGEISVVPPFVAYARIGWSCAHSCVGNHAYIYPIRRHHAH